MSEPILDKPPNIRSVQPPGDGSKELIGKLVTVFRTIPKETLTEVRTRGITVGNRMGELDPEVAQIFSEAAKKHGIKTDRTKCIFAYPRDPREIDDRMTYNPDVHTIIKLEIDPEGAIVADGSRYVEAASSFHNGWTKDAIYKAEQYYEESIPLQEYLLNSQLEDFVDFSFPEILITADIPPYRIEVVK